MADIIARFKGDTSDLDTKIKKASQTLLQMKADCDKVGGAFINLDKEQVQFIRDIGRMETGCKDARSTVATLTKSFTDLSAMYNRLSEEEKRDEGGEALRASLGTLKERIKDAQQEMKKINGEISTNDNLLEQLSGKFGINIKQLGVWGVALGAGKVALGVMKDAFFATEEGIDSWGRTVESSKGAYQTFLDTINNGNWSNFFSNLKDSIEGSAELYDKLDRLGSIKANNAAAIAIEQKALADARLKLQEAKQKGDKTHIKQIQDEIKTHEQRLAQLRNQEVKAGKAAGKTEITNALRSAYQSQEGAASISTKSLNDVADDLLKNGQDAFDKWKSVADKLGKRAEGVKYVSRADGRGNVTTYEEKYTDWSKLSKSEQNMLRMARAVTSKETTLQTGIGTYAQAVNASSQSSQESFRYNRMLGTGTGGGGGKTTQLKVEKPKVIETSSMTELQILQDQLETVKNSMKGYGEASEEWKLMNEEAKDLTAQIDALNGKTQEFVGGLSGINADAFSAYKKMLQESMKGVDLTDPLYQNLQQNLADTTTLQNILQEALRAGIDMATIDAEGLWDKILNAEDIPNDMWQSLVNTINEKLKDNPITLNFETGSISSGKTKEKGNKKDLMNDASQLAGGINSIASGLKGLGIDFGKRFDEVLGVMNSVMSIIQGVNAIIGITHTGLLTTIATNTAISASASTLDAVIPFHSGGIVHAAQGVFVPGMPNGGRDVVPSILSPGELVLNAAQQNSLAAQLQGGGIGAMHLETVLHGEDMRIMLVNNDRRRGRGRLTIR